MGCGKKNRSIVNLLRPFFPDEPIEASMIAKDITFKCIPITNTQVTSVEYIRNVPEDINLHQLTEKLKERYHEYQMIYRWIGPPGGPLASSNKKEKKSEEL